MAALGVDLRLGREGRPRRAMHIQQQISRSAPMALAAPAARDTLTPLEFLDGVGGRLRSPLDWRPFASLAHPRLNPEIDFIFVPADRGL